MATVVTKKDAIWAAVKEVLRLVVLAIPALLIQIFTGNPELAGTYGTAILFILRAVDKYIHTNPNINQNGLLPF